MVIGIIYNTPQNSQNCMVYLLHDYIPYCLDDEYMEYISHENSLYHDLSLDNNISDLVLFSAVLLTGASVVDTNTSCLTLFWIVCLTIYSTILKGLVINHEPMWGNIVMTTN
jgi:hypothetical protein